MNDKECISELTITNRIDGGEWKHIIAGPLYLDFLRNKVVFGERYDVQREDGNPAFWTVIEWIEENANDLWYIDGDTIYFYETEDAIAFKLRWA